MRVDVDKPSRQKTRSELVSGHVGRKLRRRQYGLNSVVPHDHCMVLEHCGIHDNVRANKGLSNASHCLSPSFLVGVSPEKGYPVAPVQGGNHRTP